MSNLRESDRDPNDPLYYAPRHTRFASNAVPEPFHDDHIEPPRILQDEARFRRDLVSEPPPPIPLRQRSQVFEDAVSRALQESMEPQDIYTPSMLDRREGIGLVGRFAVALGVVALIAAVVVVVVPMINGPAANTSAEGASIWRQIRTALMPSPPRKAATATLQFSDQVGEPNDTLPLGVTVIAPPPGSVVILSGLPAGTRLPAGKKVSANDWRISTQDIAAAAITPPPDFVGQVQVNAELRNAEGAALVGGTFRITWQGPANAAVAARPAVSSQIQAFAPAAIAPSTITVAPAALAPSIVVPQQPTPASPSARNIDPNEVANMIKRAQDLAAGGDIVPARLLLQRAAEARSARAALILAATYDPIVLKQSSNGPLPDIALARNWYAKAAEWGAPEAQRQLEALRAY